MSLTPRNALSSSRLPRFAPGFIFDGSRAWTDKLRIVFPDQLTSLGSVGAVRSAMAAIASGDVFKVASDGGGNSPLRLETQTAPPKHMRKWLFTASITFKRRQSGYGWSATIELDLNPIRFLAHRYMDLGVEGVSPVDLLKVNKRARENNQKATIADVDNHLMGDALGIAQTVDWSVVVGEYLHAVTALLEAELGRADVAGQVVAPTWGGWTVRELESVWEFEEQDARSTFELVLQGVRRSFPAYTLHHYPTGASVHIPR